MSDGIKHSRIRRTDLALAATVATIVLACTGGASNPLPAASDKVEPRAPAPLAFNRDIRPILADNCFACHGPDSAARKAGLRLDRREDAIARGVIVPGKPGKSTLLTRIFAAPDSPLLMPPTASHKALTPAQREVLKRWITEGAPYERHWSFQALPKTVPVPAVRNNAWPRNPIDRFVLARLEKEKRTPAPDADRADWLRRVTLDLTGLPPTLEETDAYLADRTPGADALVVDRLLKSPRYGERMATPWLDLARYADSYGYQSDILCPTWPYRDWVVKAFNDNLPYSNFLTWQLAGDLLPNATQEQRLATAFNRLHRMTGEGGSVPEEWRMEGVADRVRTFGTAFLGLTLECARCHDHKYDPVSQRDFYAFAAYFNSIDEYGLYDQAAIVPTPTMLLTTPEQDTELKTARAEVARLEQSLPKLITDREGEFQKWLAGASTAAAAPELPDLRGRFDMERFDGNALPNLAPGATQNGERGDVVPLVDGVKGKAASLDGENSLRFPKLGDFSRQTPFTIAFWMYDTGAAAEPAVIFQACSGTDAGPFGYDLLLEKGRLTTRIFRHWPGNAIAVRTPAVTVPKNTWTAVAVTYDGSSHAAGLRLYINGKPCATETVRDHLSKGTGQHTLVFGQRFRDKGFRGGRVDEISLFGRDLSPLEVAQVYDGHALGDTLKAGQGSAALREYYFSALDPAVRVSRAELLKARTRLVTAEEAPFEIAVMEEMAAPRPSYVLARGQYDAPQNESNRVGRGAPREVYPFPKELPQNRLGLARWLTLPDHPLTARVAVNHLWALFFGRGLVETVEDFGIQGRIPTHPELLDWMARDFVTSGWDVKRAVRQIVLSRTYRQASATTPALRAQDPQNLLLARGPSGRLSGEMIRDVALAASGLLDGRIGGAPVSPYQPGDLWREANTMSPGYRQSVGGDLYRRSLYTVWKRTAPMPNMIAFDAAGREVCVARRPATNTPLQALVLLNDPQFVEAARVLGERMLKQPGTTESRVRYAFRRLTGRNPSARENNLLVNLFDAQQKLYATAPQEAAFLIAVGQSKADTSLPAADLAAATVVCQAVLNLDATIWKR